MFKANKNLMNVVSAIVSDESNAFHAKMFKELRKLDEEYAARGLFSSGERIKAYRNFYHNDGKAFVVGLVEKIEELQKEQELVYTEKDWQAIEQELFRVCDDLYQHYIRIEDEKFSNDVGTQIVMNFRTDVSAKIRIAKGKTIRKITKRWEIWFKRLNLLAPWIAIVISIIALYKSSK